MKQRSQLQRTVLIFALALLALSQKANAVLGPSGPLPEEPGPSPQVNIHGEGLGTLSQDKTAETPNGKGTINFSDSALQISGAQKLYEGDGIGSFGLGWLTTDESNAGTSSPLFLHQAFLDYQDKTFEVLVGRSDKSSAHLVSFPTLRSDDLVTLIGPLNPFSNGKNVEEHLFANVASVTFNQNLTSFESFHAQHLINSADPNADTGLNSFGFTFQYLGTPGLEIFERIPSWGLAYEKINLHSKTTNGLHQATVGGLINLNDSAVSRFELGLQGLSSWGSDMTSFTSATDTFEADSNALTASLRYLRAPFGRPAAQLSLTAGYKKYSKVDEAHSYGLALTGVKRLGQGFDLVAQYQAQRRTPLLAAAQTQGLELEERVEIGFAFNFDATFNDYLTPRRTILNQQHRSLSN